MARPRKTKTATALASADKAPKAGAGLLRRRRRQLDDYEPRTTMMLRRHARRKNDRRLLDALDDPDFRRAANAAVIHAAEDEGVEVDSDRPFMDWLMSILEAIKPKLIEVINKLLDGFLSGGGVV